LGCEVLLTREPGGTRISEDIRSIILNPEYSEMSNITELLLYSASRAQLVEQIIKPAIKNGITVICDRYIDSFYAYQGYGRGISMEILEKVTNISIDGMVPDITFFLDLDPLVGLKRRRAATERDRIENELPDFYKRVYEGYKMLSNRYPRRIKTIDASKSAEDVWVDIRRQLEMTLGFISNV